MGTIGIAITAGLAGLVVGFLIACWLTADVFSEKDAEITALRKRITEANAECPRLRTAKNAAMSRVETLNREAALRQL